MMFLNELYEQIQPQVKSRKEELEKAQKKNLQKG